MGALLRCRRRTFAGALACAASTHGCVRSDRTHDPDPSESPLELAEQLARRFTHRTPAHRLPWRWDGAIAMLGLARLWAISPPARDHFAPYLTAYFRHHDAPRITMPDHCAPALAALAARPVLGDEAVQAAIEPVARFLRAQPRNDLGALDHLGVGTPIAAVYPKSIWIDSLMMYGLTAVEIGRATADPQLQAFGYAQPSIFARVLQDPQRNLFRHAYLHQRDRRRPADPVFWLRGNGWVAAALVDMLARYHRSHATNLAIFRRLTTALLQHQRDDGLWTTVIGDRRTYAEPSGTALVAYALAKGWRLGLLPDAARQAAHRAFEALANRLVARRHGLSLPGISGPTIPLNRSGYAMVPRHADLDYGVGSLLMLAAELRIGAALRPSRAPVERATSRRPATSDPPPHAHHLTQAQMAAPGTG